MIEIKITGNSIPELADKMLAMGVALKGRAELASHDAETVLRSEGRVALAEEVKAVAAAEAEKPKAKRAAKKTPQSPEQEAAPVTVVEDAPEETVVAETGEVTTAAPTEEAVVAATLAAVERVGRDKVVAILTQFGVARASLVPEELRAEYLELLGDA